MRHITEGINAIDKAGDAPEAKERQKHYLFGKVDPAMPSTEIEAIIEDIIAG